MIHGDHAKQVVISFGYRLTRPMPINIADFKIFEVATKWTVLGSHKSIP